MAEKKKPRAPTSAEKRRVIRERFRRAQKAEKAFGKKLKQVARQVGHIVKEFSPKGVVKNFQELNQTLRRYADMLGPWAKSVSESMVAEVAQRDEHAWAEVGREVGQALRKEVRRAPTGAAMRQLMEEQVELIKSIPIEAAQRVHKLTIEGMLNSTRAKETAKEIMRTTKVTESRAMLIARTETTRTATAMVQSRAQYIGSEGYIWRTAGDSDVRKIHKHLEGKFIKWSEPPISGENGERAHAGAIYNCRCYPEPVIPDVL